MTTPGSYLAKEGEAVLVRNKGETTLRVPIHLLESIVCLGPVGASPHLLGLCGKRNVSVSFLKPNGKFLARVTGFTAGNVLLRKAQYRASEDTQRCLELARIPVQAKLHNCRVVLLRAARDHGDSSGLLSKAADYLARCISKAGSSSNLNQLRGIEGESARQYFGAFHELIRSSETEFQMQGRTRRPPLDRVNALLSFLYALLVSDLRSACETVGLDPQVGFLHGDRPGRPSLALDLMEEFRPVLCDRTALSLINRQQVKPDGFEVEPTGAVRMHDETRKTLLVQYQKRKQEEIEHPFLGEKVTLGLVPLIQVRLFAKTLRGELDAYPAFLWK